MSECSKFNIIDEFKNLSLDDVKAIQKAESLPFAVAAVNVAGDLNISNILRSAVVFGAKEFILVGKKRFDRRGCVGAQNYIQINQQEDSLEALNYMMENYQPVFIEQGGEDLYCKEFYNWHKSPCLVFGSESEGLPSLYLDLASHHNIPIVSIAQIGVLRSLNVASAAAITMWKVAMDLRPIPRSVL